MKEFKNIVYTVEEGAAWIRLNRPDALNAFSTEFYREVRYAIRMADLDPNIDVVVLTGTGRAFATGGDLKELLDCLESDDPLSMMPFQDDTPMKALRDADLTIVAAINGICIAGGLIISGLCDICIAAESATFGLPEARWGLAEALSVSVLYPHVGLHRLKYMAFTSKNLTAVEAERFGLVNEVVPDVKLLERTREVVKDIQKTDPGARATYRRYFDRIAPPTNFTAAIGPNMDRSRLQAFATRARNPSGKA